MRMQFVFGNPRKKSNPKIPSRVAKKVRRGIGKISRLSTLGRSGEDFGRKRTGLVLAHPLSLAKNSRLKLKKEEDMAKGKKRAKKAKAKKSKAKKAAKKKKNATKRIRKAAKKKNASKKKYSKKRNPSRKRKNASKKRKHSRKKNPSRKRKNVSKKRKASKKKKNPSRKRRNAARKHKKKNAIRRKRKNPMAKRKRKNPSKKGGSKKEIGFGIVQLGHTAQEAFTLAAGGAFYGTAARIASKIPGVSMLSSIPVVGSSILPMLMGSVIHGFAKGKKGKAFEVASQLGKGLVAASVVSIGVNAGDKIVRSTLGKVIPGLAGEMGAHELGYDEYSSGSNAADFGELVNMGIPEGLRGADFGGSADFGYPVDAGIPEGLSGVDFTASMGDDDYIEGVDFTAAY